MANIYAHRPTLEVWVESWGCEGVCAPPKKFFASHDQEIEKKRGESQ